MKSMPVPCVLLADRHHGLTEGVRSLLETMFSTVVMVADEASLLESAGRIQPSAIVADLSLARTDNLEWLKRLRAICPDTRLLVLSVHDERCVCDEAMAAGADGFVVKRAIATDFMPGIDAVMNGEPYVSPCMRPPQPPSASQPETGAWLENPNPIKSS